MLHIVLVRSILKEGNELITAKASRKVIFLYRFIYQFSKSYKYPVPHLMPMQVIDQLEAIKIYHQKYTVFFCTGLTYRLMRTGFVQQSCHWIRLYLPTQFPYPPRII